MYLKTKEVRDKFIEFFTRNSHKAIPSSSLVPTNDRSLMFTNAGMVQFKNIFMGLEKPSFKRAVSSQKCVRAGGKHNDLDNVGYTKRHHTFFEMLGNFSFGDYFKEEAIFYAWELLTKNFLIPADKLYITVHPEDLDALNLWKKITGFSDDKIIKIKDNFWSMGDTGPCGPCTEIFYDHGEKVFGGLPGTKDEDGDRYIEIWNIVFMEFDQIKNKKVPLPMKSIDTGMGLERMAAVLQGQCDNYATDLFQKIIASIEKLTKVPATEDKKFSHRIIADHLRSSAFLIADGVLPSNEERGYVLRRIMRRGIRHLQQLGTKEPSMHLLLDDLIKITGDAQLAKAKDFIIQVMIGEESKFQETLNHSFKVLNDEIQDLKAGGILSGESAFKLYDTYGMPLDLTIDILREKGLKVDVKGFEIKMEEQKQQGKKSWQGSGDEKQGSVWFKLQDLSSTKFVGYETLSSKGKILAIVCNNQIVEVLDKLNGEFWIITDQTPFYAESGGQKGDIGQITHSAYVLEVIDTQKFLNFYAHLCKPIVMSKEIRIGDSVTLEIDSSYRDNIRKNHTATHLLHSALKKVLGDHIIQKGSLVASNRLRFDFNYDKPISLDQIEQIEYQINSIIVKNVEVKVSIMSKDKAEAIGAMMLFGEKYDDKVRVISVGDNDSIELCGGTHVSRSGNIGLFKIAFQSSVASGIRRLEALVGLDALDFIQKQNRDLVEVKELLELNQKEANKYIINLENKLLQQSFLFEHKMIKKGNLCIRYLMCNANSKNLKEVVNSCAQKFQDSIVLIICLQDERTSIIGATKGEYNTADVVKKIASHFEGSAGGSAGFAQGGFKKVKEKEIESLLQSIYI